MTLEQIPLIVGGVLGLLALWLLADAALPDRGAAQASLDRRRRARAERSRAGEAVLGLGLAAFAAALVGSDRWRWSTVAVLAGGLLVVVGLAMSRRFVYEALMHRGAARRGRGTQRRGPTRPDSAATDRRSEEAVDGPGILRE
ncbi:MAG TPA: hypothetical protein VEZ47_06595 [Gemmatirosa sp.]|nr:hypothetical protein [Gemmatirosa sp.]